MKLRKRSPRMTKRSGVLAKRAFERLRENIFRDDVLNKRRRPDGRSF